MKRNNPIRIEGTDYLVELRDRKGRFCKDLESATSFVLWRRGKALSDRRKPFGGDLSVSQKQKLVFAFVDYYSRKRQIRVITKEIRLKRKELKAVWWHYQREKKKKRRQELFDDIESLEKDQIPMLKKQRARLELSVKIEPIVLPEELNVEQTEKAVFSVNQQRSLQLRTFVFTHEKVFTEPWHIKLVLRKLRKMYVAELEALYDSLPKTKYSFIFRVLYGYDENGKFHERGAGGQSASIVRRDEIRVFVNHGLKHINKKLFANTKSYFEKGLLPEKIAFFGFTLEYVSEYGKKLKGKALEKQKEKWSKTRAPMDRRRRRSYDATQLEMKKRRARERRKALMDKKKRYTPKDRM